MTDNISSQAGLATFAPQTVSIPVNQPTLTIRTDSGVIFEVKHTPKLDAPQRWAVIGSIGRQSLTAEAIVGMVFVPGDDPLWYAKGYAQIVQRELNRHYDDLITEVPQ